MRGGLVLLAVTLLLWVWRAADFALIGSYAPAGFVAIGCILMGLGATGGVGIWRFGVRAWGLCLTLIGFVRSAITVALAIDPSVTVHAVEAQTALYHSITAIHLIAGLWLLINPPQLNWPR
ncbi:MAG: hypothetical protein AAF559_08325 [Pseudomonadota bacterium]